MNKISEKKYQHGLGMFAALGCAFIWGILPIYWKSLKPIDSMAIICYRMVLVAITTFVVSIMFIDRKKIIEPLKDKKMMWRFFIAGVIIGMNWSVYIWAVNADVVIQTCIGYYIEPLVVCFMGIIIFKEHLNQYKLGAMVLATIGVLIVLFHFGEFPTIALGLASTFAIYAGLKKSLKVDAIVALFYETVLVAPFALIGIVYFEMNGRGVIGVASSQQIVLLLLAGIFTATPLALFGMAANRISLVSLGVTEYISPSLSLLLSIFLFKEPFDLVQLYAFIFIWIGLVYFTYGEIKMARK